MKNKSLFFLIAAIMLGASSCKKVGDDVIGNVQPATSSDTTKINTVISVIFLSVHVTSKVNKTRKTRILPLCWSIGKELILQI